MFKVRATNDVEARKTDGSSACVSCIIQSMGLYDKIERARATPKPRYECEHVKAGFLSVARIDLDKWTVDVCQPCFESKAFMSMADEEPVIRSHAMN